MEKIDEIKNRLNTINIEEARSLAKTLENVEDLEDVYGRILKLEPSLACAGIQNMSPLGAAFIMGFMRNKKTEDEKAKQFYEIAEALKIQGTYGELAQFSFTLNRLV
jgi:Tfp pilus assembly protein PilO